MSNTSIGRCGGDALKLIADYWVLRIVEELHQADEPLRFCVLQRVLDGISPVTLTARLRSLDERGLVARIEGSESKGSVSYELTERGQQMLPVIKAISDFAALN